MILRKFLFLDTDTLEDYLATVDGFVSGNSIEQKETEKKDFKGGAGYHGIVEAGGAIEKQKEVKQTLAITDAAKFQKLYEILEKENAFAILDLFDQEYWEKISRGDLLEIEGQIQLPNSYKVTQSMDELSPWIDIMTQLGEKPFKNANERENFEGIQSVSRLVAEKPVSIIFTSISTPGYRFTANLQKRFLKCQIEEIEGEATIFGKVQRVIKKGEKLDVFSILPAIIGKLPSMSSTQKNQFQRELVEQGLADIVKGPALLVSVLAIYR